MAQLLHSSSQAARTELSEAQKRVEELEGQLSGLRESSQDREELLKKVRRSAAQHRATSFACNLLAAKQ